MEVSLTSQSMLKGEEDPFFHNMGFPVNVNFPNRLCVNIEQGLKAIFLSVLSL